MKMNSLFEQAAETQRRHDFIADTGLQSEQEYNECLQLIRSGEYVPTLADVNRVFDDLVTGEEENRMAGFLLFVCAKQPVLIDGLSASGKTHIIKAFTSFIPQNKKYFYDSSSDKALIEDFCKINNAEFLIMSEYNKINGVNTVVEIMKSFGEGAPYRYRRANIAKKNSGEKGIDTFILLPKPFVISIADESKAGTSKSTGVIIPTEIMSRCVLMTADSSSVQTRSVMLSKAKTWINPFETKSDECIKRKALIKIHVNSMPVYEHCLFINAAADKLVEFLPSVNATSRRNYDKLGAAVAGSARFNYRNRMSFQTKIPYVNEYLDELTEDEREMYDEELVYKTAYFCTPEDVYNAYRIYSKIVIRASLECNIRQKLILSIIKHAGKPMKLSEIFKCLRNLGASGGQNLVSSDVTHLINVGYLEEIVVTTKGKEKYYDVTGDYNDTVYLPPFKQVIETFKEAMKREYPEYADEFIRRYCGDGQHLYVNDPFTGEQVDLMTVIPDVNDKIQIDKGFVDYVETVEQSAGTTQKQTETSTFDAWM